jgi:hypothetical protein
LLVVGPLFAKPTSEAGKGIGVCGIGRQSPLRRATQTAPKHLNAVKPNPPGVEPTEISVSNADAADVRARESLGQ